MPVWWLRPADPAPFTEPSLVGFLADISQTGWYGFPAHPIEGVVKIASHGKGREMHPDSPERVVTDEETTRLRDFLAEAMPALRDAPVVYTRVCLYCDTKDGHFWIDHDPEREGLVLATGGSGHGLKFAPVLGGIIADVVERKPNPWAPKFVWRTQGHAVNEEEARHKEL
jgi:glycine/D-amino acid oxidase-like deaminating enzyme